MDARERCFDAFAGRLHLARVAGKLLPQPHGHSVLQVGAADLDDVVERAGFLFERRLEVAHLAGSRRSRISSAAAMWMR